MKGIIAVCGKGGVGKTTISALLCRLVLEKEGIRGLAIDADPGGGLSQTLALPVKKSVNDLRGQIITSAGDEKGNRATLAASIDYQLWESLTEYRNLAFLSVGRPEEEGCYCQVNSLLREAIHLLAEQFDVVIIDAEAGIEQVNRRVIDYIDQLILVSDLSVKGVRVAESIREVAVRNLKINQVQLLLNRVNRSREGKNVEKIAGLSDLPVLGWLPEDETVFDFDFNEHSFLQFPDTPVMQTIRSLF